MDELKNVKQYCYTTPAFPGNQQRVKQRKDRAHAAHSGIHAQGVTAGMHTQRRFAQAFIITGDCLPAVLAQTCSRVLL